MNEWVWSNGGWYWQGKPKHSATNLTSGRFPVHCHISGVHYSQATNNLWCCLIFSQWLEQFSSPLNKNVYHFTRTEEEAPDNSDIHWSLQKCGSSECNLSCLKPSSRIRSLLLYLWKTCRHLPGTEPGSAWTTAWTSEVSPINNLLSDETTTGLGLTVWPSEWRNYVWRKFWRNVRVRVAGSSKRPSALAMHMRPRFSGAHVELSKWERHNSLGVATCSLSWFTNFPKAANRCNENQLDATIFIFSSFRPSTSTCFGHICNPSSGGILYIHNNWYVLCFLVECLLAAVELPKHMEADLRNKPRINSSSIWFSLHRCIEMDGEQNIK